MATDFLQQIGNGKTLRTYKAGVMVFEQGTPAEHVYYLHSGRAKEVVTSGSGKEAIVGVIEAGMFFGTSAMNGPHRLRLSSVVTVTLCVITAITRESMHLALDDRDFVQMFLGYLLHQNSRTEAEKIDLLFNGSEKRLAQRLLQLARADEGPPQLIGPEITQEMLAHMIGTTRPHVNRFLRKFRRLGFIRYDGGIMVEPALLTVVKRDKE